MTKEFVKPDFKGKKEKKIIIDAVKRGVLDAYIMNPETGAPIKLPKEIAKRIANGGHATIEEIINYKSLH